LAPTAIDWLTGLAKKTNAVPSCFPVTVEGAIVLPSGLNIVLVSSQIVFVDSGADRVLLGPISPSFPACP
jgi:hypothetical protein